jgi:hypothetical protein
VLGSAFCTVLLLAPLLAAPSSARRTTAVHTSPDGMVEAVVVTESTAESWVDFQTVSPKRILLSRDERSKDGGHGWGIVKAAWTPDSQFFIASTEGTGGHQPWARPLWMYSRSNNRVFELWKFGATATDVFTLQPEGTIQVQILGCGQGNDNPEHTLVFNPHRFLTTGHLPSPACPNR